MRYLSCYPVPALFRHVALLWLFVLPPSVVAQGVYDIESITVSGGHPVQEVAGGVVYSQSYGDGCGLVPDVEQPGDKPVAATAGSSIDLEVVLMSCPQARSQPRATCSWEIPGTAVAGEESWQDSEHTLTLDVPERTGVYDLFLFCRLTGGGSATREIIQRTLYATYQAPLGTVLPPAGVWYEKACTWGGGFTARDREPEVLRQLLSRIYPYARRNWRYGSFPSAVPASDPDQPECFDDGWCHCSWQAMVAGDACNFGSCYEMSDVFENIAAILGIGGLESYVIDGVADAGFVTRAGRPAFDPRFPNNISSRAADDPTPRYLFNSHSLRTRDGLYYDATFNHVYHSADEPVALDIARKENEVTFVDSPARLCLAGPGYGTWDFYHHPEAAGEAAAHEVFRQGPCPENPADPVKIREVTFAPSGQLTAGVATNLVAEVIVDVEVAGQYTVEGAIYDHEDGSLVTQSPFWESDRSTSQDLTVEEPGMHTVRLHFSGEAIRRKGKAGPYQFRASVYDANGGIDFEVSDVPPLDLDALGEVVARITGLNTRQDAGGGLRCEVGLEVRKAGTFLFHLRLAEGPETVTYADHRQALEAGTQLVEIEVPGSAVARGAGGSYRVTVVVKTGEYRRVDSRSAPVGRAGGG